MEPFGSGQGARRSCPCGDRRGARQDTWPGCNPMAPSARLRGLPQVGGLGADRAELRRVRLQTFRRQDGGDRGARHRRADRPGPGRVRAALRVVALVVAVLGVALCMPGESHAAFSSCEQDEATTSFRDAGGFDRLDERLGKNFAPTAGLFVVDQSLCRDLDGDGVAEMVVLLGCCTVSSPTPWAILSRPGSGNPTLRFLATEGSYIRRLEVKNAAGGPVIEARRRTLTPYDANCCPTGDTKVIQVGFRGSEFSVQRSFSVPFRGYRTCGSLRARGSDYAEVRGRRTTCRTARAVVRGWSRTDSSDRGYRRLDRPRGWSCRFLIRPVRFLCKQRGPAPGVVRFVPGGLF